MALKAKFSEHQHLEDFLLLHGLLQLVLTVKQKVPPETVLRVLVSSFFMAVVRCCEPAGRRLAPNLSRFSTALSTGD
ncbi:hypothetical protein ASG52_19495 [Methylobacterium sp. Leaf456]|uniref:hypothetical protein n=1 Tax=Methylobacterium sp. Leaf456 TaxID=1736382 RepID=UPI0006FA966C|nr:hypothetical protein [Methylobacterium sp. Leaf456]KQT59918.1 hypothetical protein ASG52_19495 [Methylobacterium sp. Leaf456]